MKRNSVILACLGIAAIAGIMSWCAGLSDFVQRNASLQPPSTLQKLDAIVVLTGGTNRLDTGFDLLEKKLGKKLFISGVSRSLDVKRLLKRWKDEPQSNLDCCVVLGFEADNTAGNAVETITWLRQENFHSLYLVTANYHIDRALLEFKGLAPDLTIIPFPVIPNKVDIGAWWQDPVTRNLILREYTKYTAIRLLHSLRSRS